MKLSSFPLQVPPKLIAKNPLEKRDEVRLMVVNRKDGTIAHKRFKDILNYFGAGDTLIVNDTKIFPAYLSGKKEKTAVDIEVLLLRELDADEQLWDVLVNPARKIRVGNKLVFGEGLEAEVLDNTTSRGRTLKFMFNGEVKNLYEIFEHIGRISLPEAMGRMAKPQDKQAFQTCYAKNRGGIVPSIAGLNFTKLLQYKMALKDIAMVPLTLHINYHTFKEIEVEDITKHKVGAEYFHIPEATAAQVNASLATGKRRCAVGIDTLKAVASSISSSGTLNPKTNWTDKFITPPYDFRVCNALLTKFHLPKTTPLYSTFAFCGDELMREAYHQALKEKYRFFAYGDSMLIL